MSGPHGPMLREGAGRPAAHNSCAVDCLNSRLFRPPGGAAWSRARRRDGRSALRRPRLRLVPRRLLLDMFEKRFTLTSFSENVHAICMTGLLWLSEASIENLPDGPTDVPFERPARRKGISVRQQSRACRACARTRFAFCRPGGSGGVAAPVPIPNTAVKRPSADGTSSQDAGE